MKTDQVRQAINPGHGSIKTEIAVARAFATLGDKILLQEQLDRITKMTGYTHAIMINGAEFRGRKLA